MNKIRRTLKRSTLLLACFLAACGGGGGGSGSGAPAPTGLSYSSPVTLNAGTASTTLSPTVTGAVKSYSVSPALPAGLTLDTNTGAISGTPTTGSPATSYTITASNSAGSTTFSLQLAVSAGPQGEIKDTGNDGVPVVQISDYTPASGQSVTVTISSANATAIALTTQGSGCGSITANTVATSTLTETAAAGSFGLCALHAQVTSAAGTSTFTNQFQVTVTNVPPHAGGLSFAGGAYLPSGDLSVLPQSPTLLVTAATAPQTFINGGNGSILVSTNTLSSVAKALVSFSGIPGYYTAPVTVTNGQLQLNLAVSQNFIANLIASGATVHMQRRAKALQRGTPVGKLLKNSTNERAFIATTPTTQLNASVQLLGLDGLVSPAFTLPLTFQSVGSGPIQISLSWGVPVDLDVHVVTPAGEEIYYGNRSDSTGGTLDLDSNAACNIDNVDQENVVWSNSMTPAAGNYITRVDYWSNCGITQPIPYTVHVTVCGTSTVYTGTLSASQADAGGQGAGTTVATIPYTPCAGLSVAGSATFENYPTTSSGLSTTARILPIRHATVEVHQASPDTVLTTGSTDETGAYSLNFAMPTPGPYYVKVLASSSATSGATYSQSVINNQNIIYSIKSQTIDASTTANATGVNLASTRATSFAGAFNIFDVGLNAYNFVQAQYGTTLPMLTWQWTPGVPTCGDGKASCYTASSNTIFVLSSATDTDEYDASVLSHEFGHFFMRNVSRVASVGGSHSSTTQVSPPLAWSEGSATFFGQSVIASPMYIDTLADGSIGVFRNLETPGPAVPLGTADGTVAGNLSEANVSAVLWDLADPAQDSITSNGVTVTDVIAQKDNVFAALATLKSTAHDRGASGADLVDFLDQWLCSSYSTWDVTAGNNFRGVVTLLDKFPYTPQQPPVCN